LKVYRVEVRWDEGPSAGVTENRSVDRLVAHIAPPLASVVDRKDTDRRFGIKTSFCLDPESEEFISALITWILLKKMLIS
jgi:hypothetical protein